MKLKKILKELLIGIVLIIILLNIISWIKKPDPLSTQLPEKRVKLIDGSHYILKKGKPVMIHFWATWCRVCRLENTNIEHLSQKYEVLTIAVNSGDDSEISAYMKEHGLHFRVLNDADGSWAEQFRIKAFPTTFIYDTDGELNFTEAGYTTTAGFMARMKLTE